MKLIQHLVTLSHMFTQDLQFCFSRTKPWRSSHISWCGFLQKRPFPQWNCCGAKIKRQDR